MPTHSRRSHSFYSVNSVIDIGCGLGQWRDAVKQHWPEASYHGIEVSEHACQRYGWEHASVVDYEPTAPVDLVICSDVLQYLDDENAIASIGNLARMCTGALFFAVLTLDDWLHHCDQEHTDSLAYLRSGDWYRRHLKPHFINAGGGLFIRRGSDVVLYDLEALG